ncbi:MAG: chloride channel protein [Pseudoxanthomonas sp.]
MQIFDPLTAGRETARSLGHALRERFRTRDGWFLLLALAVGLLGGALTLLQHALAHGMQAWWYGLEGDDARLSTLQDIDPGKLLFLPLCGLLVGLISLAARARKRQLVDAVEANALYGGRMSMRDNLIVSTQTLLSNGSGASVGLEAAYAQMGAGAGSWLGRALHLRRADVRTLVGTGAGAAIAAAFGAPLAGAFYAFEIVIGAYSPSALAPVAVAVLGAAALCAAAGASPYLLPAPTGIGLEFGDYALYALLGLACALVGVAVMRLVTLIEYGVNRSPLPPWARPAIGGLLLVPMAMATPQILSSGHGALHLDLTTHTPLQWLAVLLLLKCLASGVSLGFGFRGGLFFASLFMGSLVGAVFSGLLAWLSGHAMIDANGAALIGMAALAAAVVGAPMTMAMLVLEGTHDFALTSAVIAAVLVSSTVTRQVFGYSFSTWRMHLRGAEIKSARDVGWIRSLDADSMMRRDVDTVPAALSVAEFRQRFPLGSATRAVLVDDENRYAGIAVLANLYADRVKPQAPVSDYASNTDVALAADADAVAIMRQFDLAQSDELAVVDGERHVLGVLSESFVRKRYAEELDKRQRELLGERVDGAD